MRNPILLPALGRTTARPQAQAMLDIVAQGRPPQAASDCVWVGDACCKLMSNGLYRCSWPDQPGQPGSGGACTPGVEGCPAWLINEIRRQSQFAGPMVFAIPRGVPVPSPLRRLRAAQHRHAALVRARARLGI